MTWKHVDVLRNTFGHDIILTESSQQSIVYRIAAEFEVGSTMYAVLQSKQQRKDDEVSLFKINRIPQEPFVELETILDDDEWEMISEIYDEMVFSQLQLDESEDDSLNK